MTDKEYYDNQKNTDEEFWAKQIEKARAEERRKVLEAVINCGWNNEIHSDNALYEMVEEELKG